jgi:Flp pilus assembly protein TadD
MNSKEQRGPAWAHSRRNQLICLGLVILTVAVYWQVIGFDFTYFDDDVYVSENAIVLRGLTWQGIKWAFTTNWQANWHPLTWLSLMADVSIGGRSPAVFHATNVLLHIASTLLLFALLNSLTGMPWRSGFVAALFALHPLHVESVAWVAERKDTLSTLFWMLTMLAYVHYVRRMGEGLAPGRRAPSATTSCKSFAPTGMYVVTFVLFALGLMCKPMLVTLPIVLMLLDYWPLGRCQVSGDRGREDGVPGHPAPDTHHPTPITRLIVEKLPLFALSAAACVVTIWAQSTGGAMGNLESYPAGVRIANAVVAYVGYIGKMLWPVNLAAFYPHPVDSLPWWQVASSGLLLAGLTAVAIGLRRRHPYVLFGCLWYVVTLVPVIGLVQVGDQAMADRYTYIPLVGLFIAVTWAVAEAVGSGNRILQAVAAAVIVGLAVMSHAQVGTWKDSRTLFRHAIAVTRDNTLAYNNLGYAVYKREDAETAIRCYSKSLQIRPNSGLAHNGLGTALVQAGRHEEALEHFRKAIALGFRRAGVYSNLGMELHRAGEYRGALEALTRALELAPHHYKIRYNRALVYARLGMRDQAIEDLKAALRQAPGEQKLVKALADMEKTTGESGTEEGHR